MTIFVTSDFHLNHKNICKFAKRPFSDASEMNRHIINEWNTLVGKNDDVYFLGDFTLDRSPERAIGFLGQLAGNKFLLRGNHDHWMDKARKKYFDEQLGFTYIEPIHELTVDKQLYVMSHYPMHSWNKKHYGSINLHGHVHSHSPNSGPNRIDVGWDAWETIPTLETITKIATTFNILKEMPSSKPVPPRFF
jgi:calcineurin-like phosphoesterase family protein